MGRKDPKPMGDTKKKGEKPPWAGHCTTKPEMVVKEINEKQVIAQDEGGCYVTTKENVRCAHLADVNRYGVSKRYTLEEIEDDIENQKKEADKRYKENQMAQHEFEEYILPHMRRTLEGKKRFKIWF